MLTFISKRFCVPVALMVFVLTGISIRAQETSQEGQLDKFISTDPKDTATRLEVLQQTVYEQQLEITLLIFLQQYANRIQMDRVLYPSTEQSLIPGYLFAPAKIEKGKRYPGLVIVHGGFHERLDWRFFRLIDDAVSHGYAVIFPEYRGSRGYGENHFKNDYGITDVADVLAAADFLAKQEYVDPSRLGIVGHSRGGMVTLLAIEKAPTRFKVAVDIAGLTDFVAYMSYKPDDRRLEVAKEKHFKGQLPAENLPAYMDISPINHVDDIQIPLLVLATTGDKIVPLTLHTGRLADALKARGKTFDVHIYDNAPGGHIFLFGNSEERRDCYRRTFEFVGRYLKP